jgi:hypothetical protein
VRPRIVELVGKRLECKLLLNPLVGLGTSTSSPVLSASVPPLFLQPGPSPKPPFWIVRWSPKDDRFERHAAAHPSSP